MNAASDADGRLRELLHTLGLPWQRVVPLAGDASVRRFFRVWLADGGSVVVSLYPAGSEAAVVHDARVHGWGIARGLPIPRLLAVATLGIASEDLGDEHLEAALEGRGEEVVAPLLTTLAAFQRSSWDDCPNPPFDAQLFHRELIVFAEFTGLAADAGASDFLADLARRLERHPYRLVHRDFHLHNLFWHDGRVAAVDMQDMRGGPDTYDAVSLLRERRGSELVAPRLEPGDMATACNWAPGWEERLCECGAQRSLKVIGTFLRLASRGRREYLRFLPEVCRAAVQSLAALDAPAALREAVSRAVAPEEVY